MTQTHFVIMEGIISFFILIYIVKIIAMGRKLPSNKQLQSKLDEFTYFKPRY